MFYIKEDPKPGFSVFVFSLGTEDYLQGHLQSLKTTLACKKQKTLWKLRDRKRDLTVDFGTTTARVANSTKIIFGTTRIPLPIIYKHAGYKVTKHCANFLFFFVRLS